MEERKAFDNPAAALQARWPEATEKAESGRFILPVPQAWGGGSAKR
jgi:hypothetical protein